MKLEGLFKAMHILKTTPIIKSIIQLTIPSTILFILNLGIIGAWVIAWILDPFTAIIRFLDL